MDDMYGCTTGNPLHDRKGIYTTVYTLTSFLKAITYRKHYITTSRQFEWYHVEIENTKSNVTFKTSDLQIYMTLFAKHELVRTFIIDIK